MTLGPFAGNGWKPAKWVGLPNRLTMEALKHPSPKGKPMTNDELTAAALPLSTQYFLNAIICVLREDGLVSQEQIRRAISKAKADLESQPDLIRIRASLLLEPSVGEI